MLDQLAIDRERKTTIPPQRHFIDGKWCNRESVDRLNVVSPIDGGHLTSLARGSAADIDMAVAAARRSFESGRWSNAPPVHRKKVLLRLADLVEAHALELAVLGVRDNGTEISMAYKAEPGSAAGTFRYYAEAIDKVYGEISPSGPDVLGLIHREPLGVVGAVVPWNFPLMIGAWKLAPALAAGNSVVLKPPETASLTLLRLAELAAEAGLPDGVLNVVTGEGPVVGEALGLHMDVDALVFTGSGGVGRRLLDYAARSNLKRVYLELGGKSPNIVFADAPDLEKAAKVSAFGIFRNAGQVCVAGSRLLVEDSIHDAFVEKLVSYAEKIRVGDPLDLGTEMGAVSNDAQLHRDLLCIESAQSQGAHLVTGGARILEETGGSYLQPTIFDEVTPDMTLAQEEVFGPVLAVQRFQDAEEAVALANGTSYGLAAAVWTSDLSRAHRMVRAVRAGVVHVNTYGGADMTVPLGGTKQSGNGHDKSLYALEKYSNLKTAWIALA
ncbi:aldehyde dehydrogenase [Pelagibius sp. Alg239-R121]|uniref:aldehyde dehydrogenase n=1 Tax=Pelagibius sp. Alg239-R121 TaxID=2993448 RepID=UPI0024A627C3|nr:aldehyde dehydrogenase [Pelagibius sp. Alg239-R121]